MKRENNEEEFRDEIIEKLEEQEVSIFNLRKGTLDAFLEDYCLFVEFKILKFIPLYYRHEIQFDKNQAKLLRRMKRKPYILVKKAEEEIYYFFNPESTNKMIIQFEEDEEYKEGPWLHSENGFETKSGALKFSNVTDLINGFVKDLRTRKTL